VGTKNDGGMDAKFQFNENGLAIFSGILFGSDIKIFKCPSCRYFQFCYELMLVQKYVALELMCDLVEIVATDYWSKS